MQLIFIFFSVFSFNSVREDIDEFKKLENQIQDQEQKETFTDMGDCATEIEEQKAFLDKIVKCLEKKDIEEFKKKSLEILSQITTDVDNKLDPYDNPKFNELLVGLEDFFKKLEPKIKKNLEKSEAEADKEKTNGEEVENDEGYEEGEEEGEGEGGEEKGEGEEKAESEENEEIQTYQEVCGMYVDFWTDFIECAMTLVKENEDIYNKLKKEVTDHLKELK